MCARGLLPLGSCFLFLLHASSRTRAPSLLSGSGFLFLLTMHPSDSRQRMPKPKDPALGHELPLASPIQFVSHAWPIMRLAPAPFAQLLAPPVSTPPTLSNSGSPAPVWQLLLLPVHATQQMLQTGLVQSLFLLLQPKSCLPRKCRELVGPALQGLPPPPEHQIHESKRLEMAFLLSAAASLV